MSGMKRMIDDLNLNYVETSENCMRYLCERAKVQYQPFSNVQKLVRDLTARGYSMEVRRYNDKLAVGQTLVLYAQHTKEFISGYHVWIDFKDYTVKEQEIVEADLATLYGEVH